MVLDSVANFVRGSTDAAVDSTQTTVSVVDASIFPDPASDGEYNVVVWDAEQYPRPDQDPDVEILRVTARDTTNDDLTVTRGQEGTAGASHPSGSAVQLSPTAKMFEDIEGTFGDFWDAPNQELTANVNSETVRYDVSQTNPGLPRAPQTDSALSIRPHSHVSNPVLDAGDVSDFAADFVADPFVIPVDGTFHMFFEVKDTATPDTAIAHATSPDGLDWSYDQVVLDPSEHIAFPQVFKWEGTWYMIPDRGDANRVDLYQADTFPTSWSLADGQILSGRFQVDPAITHWNGTWYIWLNDRTASPEELRLYYADSLIGGTWTQHPSSPIRTGLRDTQPAGRPVVHDDYIELFVQDRVRVYGDKTRQFRVTELSKTTYSDVESAASPLMQANRNGAWNDDGMHHIDRVYPRSGTQELAIVDGKNPSGNWSIGVYSEGDQEILSALSMTGADQSIPNETFTKVGLDTIEMDTTASTDTANNEIVVPESGKYRLNASIGYTIQTTGVPHRINARLYNETKGVEIASGIDTVNGTTVGTAPVTKRETLDSGDRISLYAYQDSGGARDAKANNNLTYLELEQG